MIKYTLLNDGSYKNNETGESNIRPGVWMFEDVKQWLAQGNIPDPEFTQEQLDEIEFNNQLEELKREMDNKTNTPLECVVNGNTYFMDAKDDSAMRFKHGIELAQMNGESVIGLVDFYNEVHVVSLEDAMEICRQQANAYRNVYTERAMARDILIKNKKK